MSIIAQKNFALARIFRKNFSENSQKNRGKFTPPHNLLFNLTKILALIEKNS